MPSAKAWARVANAGVQIGVGAVSGNPVPAVTGAISFAGWLYDTWQAAARGDSPSQKPTQGLSELLEPVFNEPDWLSANRREPDLRLSGSFPVASASTELASAGGSRPDGAVLRRRTGRGASRPDQVTRLVNDSPGITVREVAERLGVSRRTVYTLTGRLQGEGRLRKEGMGLFPGERSLAPEPPQGSELTSETANRAAIERSAAEIARSPQAGSDFDNWLRAVVEVAIAQRAAEIARSPEAGSDFDNWLRAERELKIAQRAAEIARSPEAGSDFENWLCAERELKIAHRAQAIARSRPGRGAIDNWLEAEGAIGTEQELVATRARQIAASPQAGSELDNWLRAERELRATDGIPPWQGPVVQ